MFKMTSFYLALVFASQFGLAAKAGSISTTSTLMPTSVYSQVRGPQESAKHAYQRFLSRLSRYQQLGQGVRAPNTTTALEAAKIFDQVDFSNLPVWPDRAYAMKSFKAVRDFQFLIDPRHGDKRRRSSWLYPDDGCFARAALMVQNLNEWKISRPAKLFIFGNLAVKTPNSPSGQVEWWYHVVPVVKVEGQVVILDPAIGAEHPMLIKDWIATMTGNLNSVKISVCQPTTYGPGSPCDVLDNEDVRAHGDQIPYLGAEWERLVQLKRDPVRELGDFPPWPTLFHQLAQRMFRP